MNYPSEVRLQVRYTVPDKPRVGMVVYADGVKWNPGGGEGLYVLKSGSPSPVWTKLALGSGSPGYAPPLASLFPTLLNTPTLVDSALGLGITGPASGSALVSALKALPAANKTIVARFQNSSFFSTSNGMGVVLRNSGTNKMVVLGGISQNQAGASGLEYAAWAWDSPTVYNSNFGGGVSGTSDEFWVKVDYVASTHTWTMSCSLDGVNWRVFHADSAWLGTPDQYGVAAIAMNVTWPPQGAVTYWAES